MKKQFYLAAMLTLATSMALAQNNKLQLSLGYSHGFFTDFSGNSYKETSTIGSETFTDTMGKRKSGQLNGLTVSGAYRLSDHLAAKANFEWLTGSSSDNVVPGGAYGRGSAQNPTYVFVVPGFSAGNGSRSYYAIMAGVEYRDFKSTGKLRPFGQLMMGVGFENGSVSVGNSSTHALIYQGQQLRANVTAFTIDAGAGLDLKLNKNFDLRIIQVDFVPTIAGKKDIQKFGDLRGPFPGTSFPNDKLYELQTITTNTSFQANFTIGAGIVYTPNLK